jgi:hypothetical protein
VKINQKTAVFVTTNIPKNDSTKLNNLAGAFLGFLNMNTNENYRADKVVLKDQEGNILLEKETVKSQKFAV